MCRIDIVALKVKIFEEQGTRVVQVLRSTLTVGRSPHCDVVLDHPTVHGEHLRAWTEGGRVWVQDLEGGNGTQINGTPLPSLKPMLMRELDTLKLADCPTTLALEASFVRQPSLRPNGLRGSGDESAREIGEITVSTDGALEKRRAELENLSREMAEARLQLQMSQLEQATADELSKQISKMREEVKHLGEQKVQWEKAQQENFGQERFKELSELVHMWIDKKVKPWERQVISEEVVSQWEADLNKLFRRVLMRDTSGGDRRAVEREPGEKYSESVAKRHKRLKRSRFWTRGRIASASATAAVAFLACALMLNRESLNHARVPASSATVTPVASKLVKTNYTDNVLYTEKYLETMRSADFRKLWNQELSKTLAGEWKLDRAVAEPVMAKELALIEELARLKAKMSSEAGGDAIAQMRARELAFQRDLTELLKDRGTVDRFLKFKQSFYMRHGRPSRQ